MIKKEKRNVILQTAVGVVGLGLSSLAYYGLKTAGS